MIVDLKGVLLIFYWVSLFQQLLQHGLHLMVVVSPLRVVIRQAFRVIGAPWVDIPDQSFPVNDKADRGKDSSGSKPHLPSLLIPSAPQFHGFFIPQDMSRGWINIQRPAKSLCNISQLHQ